MHPPAGMTFRSVPPNAEGGAPRLSARISRVRANRVAEFTFDIVLNGTAGCRYRRSLADDMVAGEKMKILGRLLAVLRTTIAHW